MNRLVLDKTYVYEYNNTWKDQLSKLTVNGVEEQFVYNNIGLPTKYRNQPMAWNNRNLLADYKNVLFTCDGTGMRLAKSTYVEIIDDDGTQRREITGTTNFDYEGDRLLSESRNGAIIRYIYGASGMLGFVYNNSNYYFVRNLQGDVTRIVDVNNQIVAQYTYDAWGNCTIVTDIGGIASLNAIRYRGYYYDIETGLYYLQTRYYDPEIGRFISPDNTKYLDPETLGGLNLYAYCNNNPVMYADPSGHFPFLALLIIGGALIGGTLGGITSYSEGQDILTGVLTGALLGAAAGAIIGVGGSALSGAVSSVLSKTATDLISVAFYGGEFGSWEDYAIAFAFGGITGSLGSITGKFTRLAKGAKFITDVAARPLVNQLVKMGTRGNPFNDDKYLYDVITRTVTYGGSNNIIKHKMFGLNLKLDLGKCFYRSTFRALYPVF